MEGAKVDLSELGDPNEVSKGDAWANWKNTIYGGSIVIAIVIPLFFVLAGQN